MMGAGGTLGTPAWCAGAIHHVNRQLQSNKTYFLEFIKLFKHLYEFHRSPARIPACQAGEVGSTPTGTANLTKTRQRSDK